MDKRNSYRAHERHRPASSDVLRGSGPADQNSVADVFSRMYAGLWNVESICGTNVQHTPMLLCEYAHAMGNSVDVFGVARSADTDKSQFPT